ncbi:MAG TPA: cytochrome c biogenesis protein CcsA, partial [Fibrobacteria bacterium]|nr:cytochrome c biogenesis protein CcsA [Fibrobacteria bacterium]
TGLALTRNGDLDLGPGQTSNEMQIGDRWEVVVVEHAGGSIQTRGIPLESLAPGMLLDLGADAGNLRVESLAEHGICDSQGIAKPLPAPKDANAQIPALSLSVVEREETSHRISLDGNRPMAGLPGGRGILLRRATHPMPFSVRLVSFKREDHPGSTRAKSFESRLLVQEADAPPREALIRMNHPLRIGDFTVYQSSWREDERTGEERTILAVVENPAGKLPYWATFLVALGLAVHLIPRLRRPQAVSILAAALAVPLVHAAPDARPVPPSLRQLPIQIDGRVRSFETFAEHTLLQISGRSRIGSMDACQWLAWVVLDPVQVDSLPVFLVEHPDARDALGLDGKDRDRYSWTKVGSLGAMIATFAEGSARRPQDQRTSLDREFLRLSDAWMRWSELRQALVFLRPESMEGGVSLPGSPRTFLDLALDSRHHAVLLDSLSGIPDSARKPSDKERLDIYRNVFRKAEGWRGLSFPVIPLRDSLSTPWRSPAARLVERGAADSGFRRTLLDWKSLASSWATDPTRAEASAKALRDSLVSRAGTTVDQGALDAESLHDRIRPFTWALVLSIAAAIGSLWAIRGNRAILGKAAQSATVAAWLLVVFGLVLRMTVSGRPPVTNLYETFLFSAFVTIPVFLVAGWLRRWPTGSFLAPLVGGMLLLLARGFASRGDTMPVLVAVLDSNFWLTIHVLTITIGYGGAVAAGVAGHWHLVKLRGGSRDGAEIVRGLAAFGLLFTFVGTLLGGVWADQSWGRFWGWDPKENGALLIVLWLAMLFHARSAGQIGARGFSVGAVRSIATVLFAWFGVKLMGVGLHSYGFTEGTAWGLAAYALAEAAFLAWVLRSRPASETGTRQET